MARMPRMARCQSDPIPQAADVVLALRLQIYQVGFGDVGGGHAPGDRVRVQAERHDSSKLADARVKIGTR